MTELGLKYRTEFNMSTMSFLFRDRAWLRSHGCTQEPGEAWRAADAEWYRSRGYVERPIAVWYAVFDGKDPADYRVPWPVPKGRTLRHDDFDGFSIRLDLPGGLRFFGHQPEDDGCASVFILPDELAPTDAPFYVPVKKVLHNLTIPPCLRPGDVFLPLMEGKLIYQFDQAGNAFVSGSGSFVVTRPRLDLDTDIVPHYFMARLDADRRTPRMGERKFAFRDVARWVGERTMISAAVPINLPCGHNLPTLISNDPDAVRPDFLEAWSNSIIVDFLVRLISSGHVTRDVICQLPAPSTASSEDFSGRNPKNLKRPAWQSAEARALIEAMMAALFELTPDEFAYLFTTFPLLDRDQPPLPGDFRVRATSKGIDRRMQSFITRDLALLTYLDYLAGRLEVKPDPALVSRICPKGVPDPPADIVTCFMESGVDVGGASERALAQTGAIRDLRQRVAVARELGAVAYVPTLDRRRAPFVERAAEAGGLSPEEGVLTPEMSRLVLRDKAEREGRWQRAMALWQNAREPSGPGINGLRPSPPAGSEPLVASP